MINVKTLQEVFKLWMMQMYIYILKFCTYIYVVYIYIYIEFFKKQLSGILGGTIAGHCGEISNDYMQIQKGVIYLTLRRE